MITQSKMMRTIKISKSVKLIINEESRSTLNNGV